MNRKAGKSLAVLLSLAMFFGVTPGYVSAVKKPRVTKKLLLTQGDTGQIAVKGRRIKSVKYRSLKKKIATVTKKGKVKAKSAGKCNIRVTVKYKKKKAAKTVITKKYICKVSVTKKEKKTPPPSYSPSDEFTKQTADFAVKLLQNSSGSKVAAGKNVLISPESVLCALSMTANGAGGNTLAEFEKVLCTGMNHDEFNYLLYALNANLTSAEKVKFNLANSIWVKKGLQVQPDFIQKNQSLFEAEVKEVLFDKNTVSAVNAWVKKNTDGMIDKIVDRFSPKDVMVLINALTFEGRWMNPYSDRSVSKNENFTDAKGNRDKATMLNGREYSYIRDDKAAGFVKYYEGNDFAFMALRPDDGVTASEYLNGLTGEKFLNLYKMSREANGIVVDTKMPEFSYDYSVCLQDSLSAMGIKDAFSPTNANFTNMAQTPKANLFISDIFHKTHIELDRNGTKAAAVTAVKMAGSAMPTRIEKVSLDKPFLYAIVEANTGFPIFLGVLSDLL